MNKEVSFSEELHILSKGLAASPGPCEVVRRDQNISF
jgi:hypothetical protein